MDNYRSMIENNKLIITRHKNPYSGNIEYCVGRMYADGSLDPISYGETIDAALSAASALIEDK